MKIFVGTHAYEVDSSTSVAALKAQIENAEFVPAHQICLMKGSEVLEEGDLSALAEDDELAMRLAVPVGMRKKWKKKRMRRLRRKRRKMRQRAR